MPTPAYTLEQIKIYYGFSPGVPTLASLAEPTYLDVTRASFSTLTKRGSLYLLRLPPLDLQRSAIFGDPLLGVKKNLVVVKNLPGKEPELEIFPSGKSLSMHFVVSNPSLLQEQIAKSGTPADEIKTKLAELHKRLVLRGGSFKEEFPEQVLAVTYIRPEDIVLEIGANIGRNTTIIASLLSDSSHLLTLECDPASFSTLLLNRKINGLNFKAENSALSKRRLEQKGWDTRLLNTPAPAPGWKEVKTITYADLLANHNFPSPSVIVADCEGALLPILRDEPSILDGVRLIIVENDYHDLNNLAEVDKILYAGGFQPIYSKAGGWHARFYEVWEKKGEVPAAGEPRCVIEKIC